MKTEITTKFRLRVYSLNNTTGWTEYSTAAELKDALKSEESKCRAWATEHAKDNPNDFRTEDEETGEDRPMTAEEISDWVNDCLDDNGNKPASDVAVFAPDVEAWTVDEDGDGSWESVDPDDI